MKITRTATLGLALAGTVALAACEDDDPFTPPDDESRTFVVVIENISAAYDFPMSGVFDTPVGGASPGPAGPGAAYEFEFHAPPGARLSFVTMFVQSNDLFYAPSGAGIALWNTDGTQVSGDVTAEVLLWDAGTEVDQEPGLGADQAPRQAGPNTGDADPDDTVRLAADTYGNLPAVAAVIQVTLTPTGPTSWLARIENVGDATTLMTSDAGSHPVPLSPGVFVVHTEDDPLFTAGEADRGEGLEGIAEDGAAGDLGSALAARTGINTLLSPGVWAVHGNPAILFAAGSADRGEGLEAIAEDGAAAELGAALENDPEAISSGIFNTPDGAGSPGPAMPGAMYTFTVTAEPGDRLTFVTMYAQSNDLFFAPGEAGIELFPGGTAVSGDVTAMLRLWDAGTEVNERPGFGPNQAPRQAGPDTGVDENGVVHEVDDGFEYRPVVEYLRVTITPTG